ncbi:hypothetical protein [Sphingomonas faeni]|uniref:hypothetical protein n=1 Tax=Sphingomonas faeni TaxID=185950 RepID=UPI00277E4B3C|nr:hypothetical protein [Sphingomonas faeni]MDQ0839997.1 hypothetical protein [Sphingomonas faeni]
MAIIKRPDLGHSAGRALARLGHSADPQQPRRIISNRQNTSDANNALYPSGTNLSRSHRNDGKLLKAWQETEGSRFYHVAED